MFKKLILAAVLMISPLHTTSAFAGSDDSTKDSVMMKAFACLYWECPALFIKYSGWGLIIESYGQAKAIFVVDKARTDARFFAERVLLTENGEITSEMYKRVVIKLQPDDQVTVMGLVNEPGG